MPRDSGSPGGWFRSFYALPLAIAAGTSAEECLTDYVPGFRHTIESVYVAATGGASAGGPRTVSLVRTRGSTDATIATRSVLSTDNDVKGEVSPAFTMTAGNADIEDADKLSIMVAAGGTSFTAFTGTLIVKFRARPQQLA
jgi:hypothetical protein